MRVRTHAPGPVGHGVVRHAELIAALVARHGACRMQATPDLCHAQFTDALYGATIGAAAEAFARWAAVAPRPLVLTLHDLPGHDPDPGRDARRRAGYTAVAALADVVVVSSAHEALLAADLGVRAPTVIPLPIQPGPPGGRIPRWSERPTIGVLGFVYPGKGHAQAVAAAGRHPDRPAVVALGAAADGHRDLLDELATAARLVGVDVMVTGSIDDADLTAAADAVTVPLAPNGRVSASGSLATWLGTGRRPLAATGPYPDELAARHRGAVLTYRTDDELDALVADALADRDRTRGPVLDTADEVGAAHAALYRSLVGPA